MRFWQFKIANCLISDSVFSWIHVAFLIKDFLDLLNLGQVDQNTLRFLQEQTNLRAFPSRSSQLSRSIQIQLRGHKGPSDFGFVDSFSYLVVSLLKPGDPWKTRTPGSDLEKADGKKGGFHCFKKFVIRYPMVYPMVPVSGMIPTSHKKVFGWGFSCFFST